MFQEGKAVEEIVKIDAKIKSTLRDMIITNTRAVVMGLTGKKGNELTILGGPVPFGSDPEQDFASIRALYPKGECAIAVVRMYPKTGPETPPAYVISYCSSKVKPLKRMYVGAAYNQLRIHGDAKLASGVLYVRKIDEITPNALKKFQPSASSAPPTIPDSDDDDAPLPGSDDDAPPPPGSGMWGSDDDAPPPPGSGSDDDPPPPPPASP